jgi:hypothetical protein
MSSLLRFGFLAAVAGSVALPAALVSWAGASAVGPAITVDSLNAPVGGVAKVEVAIEDVGPPGIGAWTVDVHFDPEIVSGVACRSQQGGGICNAQYAAGIARIVGTNIYGLEGDAVLASLALACKAEGVTALELTHSVFVDATPGDPTDVEPKIVNATATCTAAGSKPTATPPGSVPKVAGDANCDGVVNAIDASLVLQFAAGLIDKLNCADADYNHDGRIDTLDAALILQTGAGLIR